MMLLQRLKSLARWILHRRDVESELNRELESFIEMSAADRIRHGEAPHEARRQARMEITGIEQAKERVRTERWGIEIDRFWQDLRYGWRSLQRQPGFTAVVVLTLGIGIGVNTAIYTVVDATLLRPLPFNDPDGLMKLSLTRPGDNSGAPVNLPIWSYPKYETLRQNQQIFEQTALYRGIALNVTGDEAERVRAEEVSADYFGVLGINAQTGRTFLPEEDAIPERDFVAVISHGLSRRLFGADTNVVGKTITLDLKKYTIVGVLPAGFQGLSGPADVWVPVHKNSAEDLSQRWAHAWELVGRLKPGVTAEQAKSAVTVLGAIVDEAHKASGTWGAKAEELNEVRFDATLRSAVLVLFAAVTCVLLIACVNIANLLLARATARRREIVIRTAIGAGRARVMRQLLTESMLLAILGGVASLAVAYASVYGLSAINPAGGSLAFGSGPSLLPSARRLSGLTVLGLSSIHVNLRALLFAFATALFAGLLSGVAPSWHAARADLSGALKKTDDRPMALGLRGKGILVVLEIALAFVLLAGAGLTIKSLGRLTAAPVGINPDNVLTARFAIPPGSMTPQNAMNFFRELEARVAAQPGVVSAGVGSCPALAGGCSSALVWFRDRPPAPKGTEPPVGVLRVSPSYFQTMKIPLIRGRVFNSTDHADAPKTIVISETTAQRYFPGEDALGKPIGMGVNGFADRAEIIGIVGGVRYGQMDQPPEPDAYVSITQAPQQGLYLFVRTAGDPMALVPVIKQQASALNKNVPIYDIRTMRDRLSDAAARARFSAILLAAFASIAVVLAAIGIYGVMSYLVRQRTHEIGIRIALGARSQDVVRHVVRRASTLVFGGTIAGLAGALMATRVLATSLYEVKPHDPQTYVFMALILASVGLLASYIPARRVSAVDPAITLRAE